MPPRKRPPKSITADEMATYLAYAVVHGDKDAAVKFGVSVRTLQRKRADIRLGKEPELAGLVAQRKNIAAERCEDLLVEAHECSLRAVIERIAETDLKTRAPLRELVGAVHIVGNQLVARNVLTPKNVPGSTSADKPGAEPAASGRQDASGASGGRGAAVH